MRRFIRHPSTIPIILEPVDGANTASTTGLHRLHNIGFGGICCLSEQFIEKGMLFSISIQPIDPNFSITGEVVWCKPKEAQYELGIQFTSHQKKLHRLRMIEQICHIEHYKREIETQEGRKLSSEAAATEWIAKYAKHFPKIQE